MTDTEERIAKLQKLLDRVLSRDEPEDEEEEKPPEAAAEAKPEENGADPPKEEARREEDQPTKVAERPASPPPPEPPAALESRSRLVAAGSSPESVEELSDEDLIPDSRTPSSTDLEDAVPLVRRSRVPAEQVVVPPRREREEDEELSDGRIVLGLEDVQIADDSIMSDEERLAAEIAAEEVQSGEIQEDAPTSSRRPIALSAEERHTPPPESGKQVAASPVSDEEVTAVRKSSAPPAAGPDVIRPEIPASAPVAAFTGAPTVKRPASFGELLDEALRL